MSLAHRLFVLGVVAACGGKQPDVTLPAPAGSSAVGSEPVANTAPAPANRPKAVETPALIATALPHDAMKTTIHRLSNGMTVYISPDRQEPTITAHIAVRAGSRNDPEPSTGLAHYL